MSRTILSTLAIGISFAGLGCGDGDPGPDDTGTDTSPDTGGGDAGDSGRACIAATDWSCVGAVDFTPVADEAVIDGSFYDFSAMNTEADVTINACLRSDAECAAPVTMTTSDEAGLFTLPPLDISAGALWGWFLIEPDGRPTHRIFGSRPVFDDFTTQIFLVDEALGRTAVMQNWTENGFVYLFPVACDGAFAPGVRLELVSGEGVAAYSVGPGFSTTETQTEGYNTWIIANAVPGDFVVEAYRACDDVKLGTVEFPVRAGEVTGVYLESTPDGAAYAP